MEPVETVRTDAFGSLAPAAVAQQIPVAAEGFAPASEAPAPAVPVEAQDAFAKAAADAQSQVARCRQRVEAMHAEDQEEAINLIEGIEAAIAKLDAEALAAAGKAMSEFLFFVEGR